MFLFLVICLSILDRVVDDLVVCGSWVVGLWFYIGLINWLLSGCDCGILYEYVWIIVMKWCVCG